MRPKEIRFEDWKEDYREFQEITARFYRKEVGVKEYKGFSGGFGSYAQRGGNASMLRLRLPGGRIDKGRLAYIADCVEGHSIRRVHLTTCQTIQLHDLSESSVCEIAEESLEHGILTRGGGGDFPRNVMMSPLAGVERGEYFDVTPYAMAASDYLVGFIKGKRMPRKLKVGFSNTPDNLTHATFRDLGFAARPDGRFDVYSAGGLGNQPRFGVLVAEGIEPSEILYHIKAMHQLFLEHGNYENRSKARTRFMQESLGGPDAYRAAYLEVLRRVSEDGDLNLEVDCEPVGKTGDSSKASAPRIVGQKQEGLYAVHYHPIGGSPDPSIFRRLHDLIRDMEQVELRLSPDQSLYVVNCTGDEAGKVWEATDDGAKTRFEGSVACIGASVCQVGVRDSQGLLSRLVEMEREEGFADGVLPTVHISGCPSSCGTHQVGMIGFHGCVRMVDKTPQPAFTLHVGGCAREGMEQMGCPAGVMLERDVPEFLRSVGRTVAANGVCFEEWFGDGPDRLSELAKPFLR